MNVGQILETHLGWAAQVLGFQALTPVFDGAAEAEIHAALAPPLEAAGVDLVFACGVDMAALMAALPTRLHGAHAADSGALAPLVAASVRDRDSVLVKGSAGSRMAAVVEALKDMANEPREATKTPNGDDRGGAAHAL